MGFAYEVLQVVRGYFGGVADSNIAPSSPNLHSVSDFDAAHSAIRTARSSIVTAP